MRVKSRKPPAENLITSACVTSSRSRGRADDVVGDQMRHVAGDGEHQVVVLGAPSSRRWRRAPCQNAAHALDRGRRRCPAAASGCTSGCRRARRSRRPGPECSVPATGCAGTKCTPSGRCGATAATTAALTEPTSVTMAPGFSAGAIASATSPQAPTGTQRMTRSAPRAPAAASSSCSGRRSRARSRGRDASRRGVDARRSCAASALPRRRARSTSRSGRCR